MNYERVDWPKIEVGMRDRAVWGIRVCLCVVSGSGVEVLSRRVEMFHGSGLS